MFKSLITFVKGSTNDRVENLVDQNAITILRQQIRECAASIAAARKAVAVAIAQNEQEAAQHQKLLNRIDDLEKRTISALEQGKSDLAKDAAETIAILEAERDTSVKAQERFTNEIGRLKKAVRNSEARLRELQRGQRLVNASDKTQKMRGITENSGLSALNDAENTLERLRNRQSEMDATALAMEEMELSNDPSTLSKKLADAGCGAPLKSSADDVLARLSKKTKKSA